MSIFRRPTHAAGERWFKWQDPILQYRRPWFPDIVLWAVFAAIGGELAAAAVLNLPVIALGLGIAAVVTEYWWADQVPAR